MLQTMLQGSQGCEAVYGMSTQTGLDKKHLKYWGFFYLLAMILWAVKYLPS